MIVAKLEHWRRYFNGPIWNRAFTTLEGLTPETPEGEIILQGEDLIMRVMSYPTRTPEEGGLEAHRKYIDIQMTLVGGERIDWFPAEGLTVKTHYDETRDVLFYERPGIAPAHVDNFPGAFAVLYPEDAHMPQLRTTPPTETVKKVVIKVRLAAVSK